MVAAEKLSKMLQLGDQKLCQINRGIEGLKNGEHWFFFLDGILR